VTNPPDPGIVSYPFPTLPDYLAPGLALVFVGINPGLYSVQRGHHFARPTNRFWPALSRSALSAPIRAALGRERLVPEDDRALLAFGIGFTNVVKVPSRQASDLRARDFAEWAPRLRERLRAYEPAVACFQGITGWRGFLRYALARPETPAVLGLQPLRLGPTHLFVVPSPSPANANATLEDLIGWLDRLAEFLGSCRPPVWPGVDRGR